MRYLSLVVIVFLMWWSWHASHSPALIAENTHIEIQEDLKRVIKEYIESNLPTAKDIEFQKFWTETLKADSVRATFAYTFDDDGPDHQATRVGIEGFAVLNHKVKQAEIAKTKEGDTVLEKTENATENVATPEQAASEPNPNDYWSLDELTITNNHLIFKDGAIISKPSSTN